MRVSSLYFLFVIFSCFSTIVLADNSVMAEIEGEPYIVPGAKVHKITSDNVPGQIYELRVALPGDYHTASEKEYPVIYVLDGQWNFTLVADIVGKLTYDGMMPEAVVVAITWGGEGDNPSVLRNRDFLLTENPLIPMSGGADKFLSALTEELAPYVESLYRSNGQRVLMGASFGGVFSSYAMLEEPSAFDAYVALSAPYGVEEPYFTSKLEGIAGSDVLKGKRLFLGVGKLDSNKTDVKAFSDTLKELKLTGFRRQFKTFRGVGHAGAEPIANTYGLQFSFKRPALNLGKSFLKRYEGTYSAGEGFPILSVKACKGKLEITQEGAGASDYLASSKTTFYVNGTDIDVSFFENVGSMSFDINVQGNVYNFTRI